jgi:uncharacterized membrane protein YdjX (TVP38/TMEM64 family)
MIGTGGRKINDLRRKRLLFVLKILFSLGVLSAVIYFLLFTKTGIRLTHTNVRQMSDYLRSFGPYSVVFGMLAVLAQTLFPFLPFVIVAGANVLAFGLAWGFAINYAMSCAGAILAFYLARYYAHDWVEGKLSRYPLIHEFSRKMESGGFFYVAAGRLVPVLPSFAINLAAGSSKMRFRHFFAGTLLGKLPMVYMESALVHDLMHLKHNRGRLLVILAILLLLFFIGNRMRKKFSGKSKL